MSSSFDHLVISDKGVGLKGVITQDGVWRIRKREKVPVLEIFKLEDTGHGDILSPAFIEWRSRGMKDHGEEQHDVANHSSGNASEPP